VEICPLVTHTAARQPRHLTGFPGQLASWSPARWGWYATAMTVRQGDVKLAIVRDRGRSRIAAGVVFGS
jgi:hypothetical protein